MSPPNSVNRVHQKRTRHTHILMAVCGRRRATVEQSVWPCQFDHGRYISSKYGQRVLTPPIFHPV